MMLPEVELASDRRWRPATEDNLSTLTDESGSSELRTLRFPNLTRVSPSTVKKRKATIFALVSLIVLIGGITFVSVISGSRTGESGKVIETGEKGARSSSYLYVQDRESRSTPAPIPIESVVPDLVHSDKPQSSGDFQTGIHIHYPSAQQIPNVTEPSISTTHPPVASVAPEITQRQQHINSEPLDESTTVRINTHSNEPVVTNNPTPKSKKKKKRKMKMLPPNAQDVHPTSLLQQMRLVNPQNKTYLTVTKCEDIVDNKHMFIGWRVTITLDPDIVTDTTIQNCFEGYGQKIVDAKKIAAEAALMAVYPELKYPSEDFDFSKYKKYCD